MVGFITKRLFLTIPVLLGIVTITFVLIHIVPGDPVLGLVGERATRREIEALRREYGFDRSIVVQYIMYLGRIVQFDFGRSLFTKRKVSDELIERFPNTLLLAFSAMVLAVSFGLIIGIISAIKRGTLLDFILMAGASFGISTPVFWLGLLLIFTFSVSLRWLPASGMGDGQISFIILPAITLSTRSIAFIARITRSSFLEVLGEDYIKAARAKGLRESVIILKHAFRNAMIPIITLIALDFGSYLNGSVLTETIFGWPGIGRYAVEGIMRRDMPVVMGTVLFGAIIFLIVNLLVDVLYHYINPKIRLK
jgi:ABC-type dipeptide/oligopeptide/nickel transport system permease component